MTIQQAIAASGIYPALRNAEAESCAQDLAAVIMDAGKRQAVYAAFVAKHPGLKAWEAQAIKGRALCIAKASQDSAGKEQSA